MAIKIKIRLVLWAVLLFASGWFLYRAIVPGGQIAYINDFEEESDFIRKISPADRVSAFKGGTQKITGNPVYFTLRTPRTFDEAKVTIRYKNDFSLPLIEIGALVDKTVWRYDLQPLENNLLDGLGQEWRRLDKASVHLWQKGDKYQSIEDFLAGPPPAENIALYNYDFNPGYKLPEYSPAGVKTDLPGFKPLIGSWQAYVYLKKEDLAVDFELIDSNLNDDADPVDIYLYFKNELIYSDQIADEANDQGRRNFSYSLDIPALPEGAYKLEAKANDDIIFKAIKTALTKFSFIGNIELVKDNGKAFEIVTDSRDIFLTTVHPDRVQTVKSGSASIALSETYRQFSGHPEIAGTSSNFAILHFEKDGVKIGGDGVLAFSEQAFFNPKIKKAASPLDPASAGVEYILADYNRPVLSGDWRVQSAKIDLKSAYREDGKYSLLISIPGLGSAADEEYVEIDEIRIELFGRSLWEKLVN